MVETPDCCYFLQISNNPSLVDVIHPLSESAAATGLEPRQKRHQQAADRDAPSTTEWRGDTHHSPGALVGKCCVFRCRDRYLYCHDYWERTGSGRRQGPIGTQFASGECSFHPISLVSPTMQLR